MECGRCFLQLTHASTNAPPCTRRRSRSDLLTPFDESFEGTSMTKPGSRIRRAPSGPWRGSPRVSPSSGRGCDHVESDTNKQIAQRAFFQCIAVY
eukprot:6189143-Pleurochrysis_carterae.AAC.1